MTDLNPRAMLSHRWGTPYRGYQTCAACGIPDTSSRASEPCLRADVRLATDAEANQALSDVLKKYPTLMQRQIHVPEAGADPPAKESK